MTDSNVRQTVTSRCESLGLHMSSGDLCFAMLLSAQGFEHENIETSFNIIPGHCFKCQKPCLSCTFAMGSPVVGGLWTHS
jgi:hypothetical protein